MTIFPFKFSVAIIWLAFSSNVTLSSNINNISFGMINLRSLFRHYSDVIMGAIASQITSLTIIYSTVYSDADQHQSSASLAFEREFTGDRWIPRTNGQLREKCFHLMTSSWIDNAYKYIHQWLGLSLVQLMALLKGKCCHFDNIFDTGCNESCHFFYFCCSQRDNYRQNDDISFCFSSLVVRSTSTQTQIRLMMNCAPLDSLQLRSDQNTKTKAFIRVVCNMSVTWRHQMETFSALLANVWGIHRSPHKGQWRGALNVFFDLSLNKPLSKQLWDWWFEMPSRPLWRHCNDFLLTAQNI